MLSLQCQILDILILLYSLKFQKEKFSHYLPVALLIIIMIKLLIPAIALQIYLFSEKKGEEGLVKDS